MDLYQEVFYLIDRSLKARNTSPNNNNNNNSVEYTMDQFEYIDSIALLQKYIHDYDLTICKDSLFKLLLKKRCILL